MKTSCVDAQHRPAPPPEVPLERAGKWLAFDHKESRILAAERTFAEAKAAAEQAGKRYPVLVKAPRADVLWARR
jgi:hypothetical protein